MTAQRSGYGRAHREPWQACSRVGPASRRAVDPDVRPACVAGVQERPDADRDPHRREPLGGSRGGPRRHRAIPGAGDVARGPAVGGEPRWRCVMKRRRQHGVPVIGALVLLAVIAAAVQIAEHLALLAVIVAVAAGRTTSGRHGRRRARTGTISPGPGQGQASEPAAAAALPVATLPLADYRDEARMTSGRPGRRTGTRCSLIRGRVLTRSGGRHEPGQSTPRPTTLKVLALTGQRRYSLKNVERRPACPRPPSRMRRGEWGRQRALDAAAGPLAADRRDRGLHGVRAAPWTA